MLSSWKHSLPNPNPVPNPVLYYSQLPPEKCDAKVSKITNTDSLPRSLLLLQLDLRLYATATFPPFFFFFFNPAPLIHSTLPPRLSFPTSLRIRLTRLQCREKRLQSRPFCCVLFSLHELPR